MSLAHLNWFSQTLGKMVETSVILPETGAGPFPTLYLLHGLSDDHTAWLRRSRLEWYCRDLPLIVAMADGHRNFYTDNADGPAYATFFAVELPAFIERTFHARTERAGRCAGGLSMGGYGALRLALGYPDRYASAHSHSGALFAWRYDENRTTLTPDEHRRIFGRPSADGSSHDLLALAILARDSGIPVPKLRIDCGTDDFLLPVNSAFTAELRRLNIAHEYAEHSGAHDWDYWDLHIRDALRFHLQSTSSNSRPHI
jgi:putative tributyrin esterase